MYKNKGEEAVTKYITPYFKSERSIVLENYPVYLGKGGYRRELDFLIIDRDLGLVVVESKGILIENIEKIIGYTWYCSGFYEEKIMPFKQMEMQIDSIGSLLSDVCNNEFQKHICLALPFIERKEWEQKFRNTPNIPKSIIFKDDLISGTWIKIVKDSKLNNVNEPIDDGSWESLFNMMSFSGVMIKKPSRVGIYSVLFMATYSELTHDCCSNLINMAKDGAKVFVLTDSQQAVQALKKGEGRESYLENIEIHISESRLTLKLEIINGNVGDEERFSELVVPFIKFNREQYLATHAPVDKHVFVTASAGTGKTYLMVERLIYLMTVHDVDLSDITFVTFTNASTDDLKRRIREKALDMFQRTRSSLYILLLERVNDLKISTIHSFLRGILRTQASTLGLSRNFKISGKKHLKNNTLEELIDSFFNDNPTRFLEELPYDHYQLTRLLLEAYDIIEKVGVPYNKVSSMVISDSFDAPILSEIMRYTLPRLDVKLRTEKLNKSEVEVSDLIRMVGLIDINSTENGITHGAKFLFVDEFQDTDRSQIRFFADVLNRMNFKAFFVGDIKQSIYRFRGADYTGFDLMHDWTELEKVSYELRSNYRSITLLLDKLNCWFSNLNRVGLINYEDKDWVRGVRDESFTNILIPKVYNTKEQHEKMILEVVQDAIATRRINDKGKRETIALLTRSNNKAKIARSILESNGIRTVTSLTGSFFTSKPVLDFRSLLEGLLYLDDPVSRFNLYQSPYFGAQIQLNDLIIAQGQRDELLRILDSMHGNRFLGYIEKIKYEPFLSVLQRIVTSEGLLSNVYTKYTFEGEDDISATLCTEEYAVAFDYLLKLIQTTFSTDTTNIVTILEWLQTNISTNEQEDGPHPFSDEEVVYISTVHKAKGLEYGQVIIPFTDEQFDYKDPTWRDFILVEDENGYYSLEWSDGFNNKSENYDSANWIELEERRKEEARILYVMLTRAERKIVYFLPKKIQLNTWAEMIQIARGEQL